jgi:hypothetical protein
VLRQSVQGGGLRRSCSPKPSVEATVSDTGTVRAGKDKVAEPAQLDREPRIHPRGKSMQRAGELEMALPADYPSTNKVSLRRQMAAVDIAPTSVSADPITASQPVGNIAKDNWLLAVRSRISRLDGPLSLAGAAGTHGTGTDA